MRKTDDRELADKRDQYRQSLRPNPRPARRKLARSGDRNADITMSQEEQTSPTQRGVAASRRAPGLPLVSSHARESDNFDINIPQCSAALYAGAPAIAQRRLLCLVSAPI